MSHKSSKSFGTTAATPPEAVEAAAVAQGSSDPSAAVAPPSSSAMVGASDVATEKLSAAVATTEFWVSPRTLCQVLLIAVSGFTVAGAVVQIFKYVLGHDYLLGLTPLFALNSETSIPTWYATVTLLLCSILLAVVFRAKRRDGDRFALHWGLLSIVFLYLSADEGGEIHETIGTTLRLKLIGTTHGFLRYTWVIYGTVLVVAVAASFIKFLAHLSTKTRRLFILAGFVYVLGALGMEIVGGRYADLYGSANLTYQMMTVVEESLEMAGILIFIYALMAYMGSYVPTVTLHVERNDSRSKS